MTAILMPDQQQVQNTNSWPVVSVAMFSIERETINQAEPVNSSSIIELPVPNSGNFTFAAAEARKSEIYLLGISEMKTDWKSAYGFNVHITCDDEIVIYNGAFDLFPSGKMSLSSFQRVLTNYFGMQFGNAIGVLITSERDPRSSHNFSRILDLLFQPRVQIFYNRHSFWPAKLSSAF